MILMGLIHSASAQTNEWAWMSGTLKTEQIGIYGALGKPADDNIPGNRTYAASWTDSGGHLWLFGGFGFDGFGNWGYINDLWEFNISTNQWTWMNGSSTMKGTCDTASDPNYCGEPGVYGTLGKPDAANSPGGRQAAASWTDKSGNLWLFGGYGLDANGTEGYLNDIWEFTPATNEWTWRGGNSTMLCLYCGQRGIYGTLGEPAGRNIPGSREQAAYWTDNTGNFWLFGGDGCDYKGNEGYLSDLWEFTPATNEWTWVNGLESVPGFEWGNAGVYGDLGIPDSGNDPGSRAGASTWASESGELWLFGGFGFDINQNPTDLNDLWKFNPSTREWTWMSGGTEGGPGYYGALGTPAPANVPASRDGASNWTDKSGYLWLFAGSGTAAVPSGGLLDDLWVFNTVTGEWAWMSGTPTGNPGVNGELRVPAPENIPGTRGYASSWTDNAGHFWLFGDAALDDLWEYWPSAALLPVATPAFSIKGGVSLTPLSQVISDKTPSASIYFTLDGTTPTIKSTKYTAAITIAKTTTLKAIAEAAGYANSAVASATYTITPPAPEPVFNVAGGVYHSTLRINLADAASKGLVIYYSTNGDAPTTASTVYTSAGIHITSTTTIKAIANATGYIASPVATATYTLELPPSVIFESVKNNAGKVSVAATIGDQNLATQVWIACGTSPGSLTMTTAKQTIAASAANQSVTFNLTGLSTANSKYYFQPIAQSVGGTGKGSVGSFPY